MQGTPKQLLLNISKLYSFTHLLIQEQFLRLWAWCYTLLIQRLSMYSRDSVISLSKLKTWTRACVQSLHSCLTLCDPVGCNPLGSSVCGIFPTRMLEWVAMLSSRGSSPPRDRTHISCMSCIAGGFFTAESLEKPPEDGLLNLNIITWLCQRVSIRKLRSPPPPPHHTCFGNIFCQLPQFSFYLFFS